MVKLDRETRILNGITWDSNIYWDGVYESTSDFAWRVIKNTFSDDILDGFTWKMRHTLLDKVNYD